EQCVAFDARAAQHHRVMNPRVGIDQRAVLDDPERRLPILSEGIAAHAAQIGKRHAAMPPSQRADVVAERSYRDGAELGWANDAYAVALGDEWQGLLLHVDVADLRDAPETAAANEHQAGGRAVVMADEAYIRRAVIDVERCELVGEVGERFEQKLGGTG